MAPNSPGPDGGSGPLEDPLGTAGDAVGSGIDGLAKAADAAADGINQAMQAAGEFLGELIPFLVIFP